jgi:spore coat protein CotH
MGPDGLGVGEAWLPPADQPEEDHRYRGRSLVRIRFVGDGSDPSHWVGSDLDRESPGVLIRTTRTEPIPVALDIEVEGLGDVPLPPDQPIRIHVVPSGDIADLRVEWFVDDLRTTAETVTSAPLELDGERWTATLPGLPAESILRYRIAGDGGDGDEVIAPRDGDPLQWFGAFVGLPIEGNTRAYRFYISPADWVRMWINIQDGRVVGCSPNPTWNDREAAVFVWGSEVYDVRVRYQGSRYQRRNGPSIAWTEPDSVPILSWRVAFPRYARFEGMKVFTLNKLRQTCPGMESRVGFQLFGEAGLPVPNTRYIRQFVNGVYFNYAIEIERPGRDLYERWHAEQAELFPELPVEPGAGDLFKAVGCACNEGPFGWADERLLESECGYSIDERYAHTYDRKTWQDWGTPAGIRSLLEGLYVARSGTDAELRAFLEANYVVDKVLTHMAIINWAGPWDDMWHNHYLYQRRSDGRWMTNAWDLDLLFGPQRGAGSSIYVGEQGDRSNQAQWWNRTKDSFLRVFRAEYEARLLELNNTVLHPDNVVGKVDAVVAEWDLEEIEASAGGATCNYTSRANGFRDYAIARHAYVNDQLAR